MTPLQFDVANPDLDALRQVVFARLRVDHSWDQIGGDVTERFKSYVELTPSRQNDRRLFTTIVMQLFWQLTLEGIIAPGLDPNQGGFPWFSITPHGRRVLADREYVPHDRRGYLHLLHERIPQPDPTVLAYLDESLQTFTTGNLVASTIMLGVAAERVFDLVCESVREALLDDKEATTFGALLELNAMKPKLGWLHEKLRKVQEKKPKVKDVPENITLMVTTIYDLLRVQRNDFGHPSDVPPRTSRSQAYANLLVFPPYYERAEEFRNVLVTIQI